MDDQKATYDRVMARFTDLVDSISATDWSRDTPCEGWTVRDLLEHIVVRDRRIAGSLGGDTDLDPALPDDADLKVGWHEQLAWWAAGLADPVRSQQVWPTFFGEMTFHDATMAMMTGEITIHTWDLARALGADDSLDAEAVEGSYARLEGLGDQLHASGAMAPAITAPADADLQTRLLALTGRRAF